MVAAVTGFPAQTRLRPYGGPAASRRYERRRPEKTPLHRVVSQNLASWLEWRDQVERPVPGSVEEEFRAYLECGILCFGFGRALCTGCGQGIVVAFSRKGRIPTVPVRQWVISVPKRLRGFLPDRPEAVAALTKIVLDEIERLLCAAAGATPAAKTAAAGRPRLGSISFLHRFG